MEKGNGEKILLERIVPCVKLKKVFAEVETGRVMYGHLEVSYENAARSSKGSTT
ncbi:MAG: hypothetical protein ACM3SR_11840 [Ignavibacteriales bacterium]